MAESKGKKNKSSGYGKAKNDTYSKGLTDNSGRDGFYRNNIDVSRWSYGTDIFKSNFGKLIGINLLMLVFIAPIVYFLFVRYSEQYTLARLAPFTANIGVGYVPYTNLVAQEEYITLRINFDFFKWLPLLGVWLSVGLSGAMYVMRNICWGEEVSLFKDFFLGIKRNFFPVLIATILFTLVFSSAWVGISYLDYVGALAGGKAWYQIVVKIVIIIGMVFAGLWYMAMLSMSVTYKGNFFRLLKNSLLVTGVLIPVNVFFAGLALIPFGLLLVGSSFLLLGLMVIALIGISFFMLVWTLYSQWIYDKFINKSVTGYKPTEEEIAKKQAREAARAAANEEDVGYETVDRETKEFAANAKPITDTDVAVTDLPEVFTLDDIVGLKTSKEKMKQDAEEYSADPKAYRKSHKMADEAEVTGDDETIEDVSDADADGVAAEDTDDGADK